MEGLLHSAINMLQLCREGARDEPWLLFSYFRSWGRKSPKAKKSLSDIESLRGRQASALGEEGGIRH